MEVNIQLHLGGATEGIEDGGDPYGIVRRSLNRLLFLGYLNVFESFRHFYHMLGSTEGERRNTSSVLDGINDHWILFHKSYHEVFHSHEYLTRFWPDPSERDPDEIHRHTKQFLTYLGDTIQCLKDCGLLAEENLSNFDYPWIYGELHDSILLGLSEQLNIASENPKSASEELSSVLWKTYDRSYRQLVNEILKLFVSLSDTYGFSTNCSECLNRLIYLSSEGTIGSGMEIFYENLSSR